MITESTVVTGYEERAKELKAFFVSISKPVVLKMPISLRWKLVMGRSVKLAQSGR